MSKKYQNENKHIHNYEHLKEQLEVLKIDEDSLFYIIIGNLNVKRWDTLKAAFFCDTHIKFITKLLDIAEEYLKNNPCKQPNAEQHEQDKPEPNTKRKRKKIETKKAKGESDAKQDAPQVDSTDNSNEQLKIDLDCNDNPQSIDNQQSAQTNNLSPKDDRTKKRKNSCDKTPKKDRKETKKVSVEYDVKKAPENGVPLEKVETESASGAPIQIKQCHNCGTSHIQDHCPLNYPNFIVSDYITYEEWQDNHTKLDDDNNEDANSYWRLSLPHCLEFIETETEHGLGVAARNQIQEFTQFGPIIGKIIKEVDIAEDFNMRDLWEIIQESNPMYFSTEDVDKSNWMRFVRPAPTRNERNITVISKHSQLFFVSTKSIKDGDELLYWQDCSIAASKKKLERTSCGGCNMTFAHPLYYALHCSVFHDARYSLTIRKYHCKVCGAAVLGKENIMKHAAELHNGQGAYQCQFCKKFFLRLNYLEIHRTYGCSANPHRSRPLCDFCGRKFCQPQKLKVHIKRMHSDFAEVLKEFQCKDCLKILGSRAALQRHAKEVHQKQADGACSCAKCGKHFQNKSNLKIHMLTHSGIKPFKCTVEKCTAAFTTKQCLQFHYKKVHNFSQDVMPKIQRSVEYTFEAYSGLEEQEENKNNEQNSNGTNTQSSIESNGIGEEDDDDEEEEEEEVGEEDEDEMVNDSGEDEASNDSKIMDDPQPTETNEQEKIDNYNVNSTMKILSKGSKKWIGDLKTDVYQQIDQRLNKDELNVTLQLPDNQIYNKSNNLNDFNRHEASNASLLVEAALDSVCSEPNIDIDVSTTPNDTLVNNLYNLAPTDNLPDYGDNVCMNESRDINLISPSVNDHISVTDELNDELRQNQNIGMDYSSFHQEDFSPTNSPDQHRTNFVRNYISSLSPNTNAYNTTKNLTPSPPRYDFGHTVVNTTEHLSSDDNSNGMAAQNLSVHAKHDNIQLDLSLYKSSYRLDPPNYQPRKDYRIKLDDDIEKKQIYNGLSFENPVKIGNQLDVENVLAPNLENKDKELSDTSIKYPDDLAPDLRNKFDIDLDLRLKSYELENDLRTRNLYENTELDFRNKSYEFIDSTKYDDSEFRSDRNFEPLVLNSSELQGLDMSARSFHNYPNINRYHHLYPDVDRVDLRLNYSPPAPPYAHADILRVVSLDLTPPGRHSVDLTLRGHPLHQIANTRLLTDHTNHRLLDQGRLLGTELTTPRHLTGESRLLGDNSGRILSDHTTNRILSNNDQLTSNHLLAGDDSRLLEQSRLLSDGRLLTAPTTTGSVSPVPPAYGGYTVAQSPYHPTPLAPRTHVTSPTPTPYHHYSTYY